MHTHMLPKQPLKPLTNWVLRCWNILHTIHITDLAPSNYHLFASLKDALWGHKFFSDEAVHKWLCDQPVTFFSDGIDKLVDCWNKWIEIGGDYVKK